MDNKSKISLFDYMCIFPILLTKLTEMTDENWTMQVQRENNILINYLIHTYDKLVQEDKVIKNSDFVLFNTGLFDKHYEPIYSYAEKNLNEGRQPFS